MPTKYSTDLVESVLGAEKPGLGQELAKVCIEANLPAVYVAKVLGVTRMTLHTWFRGGNIRQAKKERINLFIDLIDEDTRKGVLPAKTFKDAKEYLKAMGTPRLSTDTQEG
jgi:hypothetical protein